MQLKAGEVEKKESFAWFTWISAQGKPLTIGELRQSARIIKQSLRRK